MADREARVRIRTTSEGSGAADAAAGVNAVGTAATGAEAKLAGAAAAAGALRSILSTLGITVGLAAVQKLLVDSVKNAEEAAQAEAQLAAVIESTGSAAGKTVEELKAYAGALQSTTNFGDEAIEKAQALLLTFTNIGGPEVDAATKAVLDISTALGQDLKSSAIQVGKALNDPLTGLTALRRVGVSFSEDQRRVIKDLVETGNAAEAQRVILAELSKEFGGQAEAARNASTGMQALANVFGDLLEKTGEGLSPALKGLTADLTGTATEGGTAERVFRSIGASVGTLIDWISLIVKALGALDEASVALQDGDFGKVGKIFDDLSIASEQTQKRVSEAWSGTAGQVTAGARGIAAGAGEAGDAAIAASEKFEKWTSKLGANEEELRKAAAELAKFTSVLQSTGQDIDKDSFGGKLAKQIQDLLDKFQDLGQDPPAALSALAKSLGVVTSEQEKLNKAVDDYLDKLGKGKPSLEEFEADLEKLGAVIAKLGGGEGGAGSLAITVLSPEAKAQLKADLEELLKSAEVLGQQIPEEVASAAQRLGLIVPAYRIASEAAEDAAGAVDGVSEAQKGAAKSSEELKAEVEAQVAALRAQREAADESGRAAAGAGEAAAGAAAGVKQGAEATGEAAKAAGEAAEKQDAAAGAAEGLASAQEKGAAAAKDQAAALAQAASDAKALVDAAPGLKEVLGTIAETNLEPLATQLGAVRVALEAINTGGVDFSAAVGGIDALVAKLRDVVTTAKEARAAVDSINTAGGGAAPEEPPSAPAAEVA